MNITLLADNQKFLCAEDGGGEEGQVIDGRPAGLLTANRESAGGWETFEAEQNDDNTWSLKTKDKGKYLCCENAEDDDKNDRNGTLVFNRDSPGAWEKFDLWELADGRYAFESVARPGWFIKAFPEGHALLARPEANGVPVESPGGYESFISDPPLVDSDGGSGHPDVDPIDPGRGHARVDKEIYLDNAGPFVPVGLHFGEAFSAFCRGKTVDGMTVEDQLKYGVDAGYDHFRSWGNLGYYQEAWNGREVAFVDFTARNGKHVPVTPGYYDRADEFFDMAGRVGIRVLWDQGDMNSMQPDQIKEHQYKMRSVADRHSHVVFAQALANEKWQNFPESIARDENWAVACMKNAWGSSPYILQNSCPPGSGESAAEFAMMANNFFNCQPVHGTRNFNDMEFVLRRFFNYGYERYPENYHGTPYAMESTEPGGPGQGVSVGNTSEVWKIVGMHIATLIGRTAIVYMSGHGVFWNGPIQSQPAFKETARLKSIFPSNAFTFTSLHGNKSGAWFTSEGGFADKGSGYGRVDQLVSDSNRFALCIAHGGKGNRRVLARRDVHVNVMALDLTPRFEMDVHNGQSFDAGGDTFFTASLL